MQKNLSLVLACAVTVLLAICVIQSFQISDQKQQINGWKDVVSTNATQIKALQSAVKRMESQKSSYNKEIRNLSQQNSDLARQKKQAKTELSNANKARAKAGKEDFSGMLAEMMKDPEMKKAMEAQQRQVLKTMYGALFKELKMTPEETDRFNELLLNQQMQSMDHTGELMSKDGDKSELTKQMAASRDEMEAQIKDMLGDDRFAAYKQYNETISDRMTLDQFKTQFSGVSLTDQQQQQLLQIMGEERKSAGMADFSKAENFAKMSEAGGFEKILEQQKTINEHVYSRATELLSPDQLQSFGTFQTNFLAMQQAGIKMAQKMWGSKTNEAAQ